MGILTNRQKRKEIAFELQNENMIIHKKSRLLKQSKYLKQWRDRETILTKDKIYTFDLKSENIVPTAIILLTQILNIKKDDQNGEYFIEIGTKSLIYKFKTKDEVQRDEWVSKIKLEKLRLLKESKIQSFFQQDEAKIEFLEKDIEAENQ